MAQGDVKKFLKNINTFVNKEYKRGALDKFPTIVTITKESLAQGFLEGYERLKDRKQDYIQLTAQDLYPIAGDALDAGAAWASNPRTRGTLKEHIKGERLVYSANRDIKRPYDIIKKKGSDGLSALLVKRGSTALKKKQAGESANTSEVGVVKSSVHRGHQGVTTVGSAQLSAAMAFLSRTTSMAGFAGIIEGTELGDRVAEINAVMKTTGTKKSGGFINLKESVSIELEPMSENPRGAQDYDYSNLRRLMEKAVTDYVEGFGIKDLPGSKSIEQNAFDAAAVTVVETLTKSKRVKAVNKPKYEGRKAKSVQDNEKFRKTKPRKSTKKAKVATNRRSDAQAPMNINMVLGILNQRINAQVASNMQSPALNYRTGRFANSIRVTDVVKTPQGFYSAGYTYQKSPYQTFEVGYAQGTVDRDPRRLIDRSIREIAAEMAVGRFYTRRV